MQCVAMIAEQALVSKLTKRLIPYMFLLYIVAYLDRINVGYAALQLNKALKFDPAEFGLAGIFFIGYFLFEVPSNLIMQRTGARIWIARILVTWGIISSAMMFVNGKPMFYVLRFLLGIAEAGFFPGMILYLTYWFPAESRGRAIANFMTATAIAGVIGGPLSGLLLKMDGVAGLAGWQWLFLIEGIPAVLLGFVTLVYLPDSPKRATWLTSEEKDWIVSRLQQEREQARHQVHHTLREALSSGRVWTLAFIYFSVIMSFYGISFWLPQIVKSYSGLSDVQVGFVSAIPYLAASIAMVIIGRSSDRTHERRFHVGISALAAAAGLTAAAFLKIPGAELAALSLAAVGIWGTLGPFWAMSSEILSGTAAAAGIALINSVGNLGGFLGPYLIGLVRKQTDSFALALLALAVFPLIGGLVVLLSAALFGQRASVQTRLQ
jgi:ACS family tartrate transporter-like MFS transporter